MHCDARFSPCGTYRYRLMRRWDDALPGAAIVMLNPSTADDRRDDPTIRSCIRLARGHGFGAIEVVNLFALRATDPRELALHPDPVGPRNDEAIDAAARCADAVIAAWGARRGLHDRAQHVETMLSANHPLLCFGQTDHGHPRHPLYLPTRTPLVPRTTAMRSASTR